MEQLFTRGGVEKQPNAGTGKKPVYRYVPKCTHCGGAGQAEKWRHTGLVCYECGGSGLGAPKELRLYTAVELARLNKAAATRAAKREAARVVAAQQAAVARAAQESAYRQQHADFLAKLGTLCVGDGSAFFDRLAGDLLSQLREPSERVLALVEGEVAKRAKNAYSTHFGAVGDKVVLTLTVERIVTLDGGFYGTNWIVIGRTAEGNVVTYKGRTDLGAVGETTTVKATIAGHDEYNGTRQTVIQRPKLVA